MKQSLKILFLLTLFTILTFSIPSCGENGDDTTTTTSDDSSDKNAAKAGSNGVHDTPYQMKLRAPLSGALIISTTGYKFGDDWEEYTQTDIPIPKTCGGEWKNHIGYDFKAAANQNVFSVADGIVNGIYDLGDEWKKVVIIEHENSSNKYTVSYMHVDPIITKDSVLEGEKIATVAAIASGSHLHLNIRRGTFKSSLVPHIYTGGNYIPADDNYITKRGALPAAHGDCDTIDCKNPKSTFTGCKTDPLYPDKFIDPNPEGPDVSYENSDLVIETLSVNPASGEPGSSATVSFTVKNQGKRPSNESSSNIRINSSSSDVYESDALLFLNLSIPKIAANNDYEITQNVTIPSDISSGDKYIWVILDVNHTANQSDETNDKDKAPFTVTTSTPAATPTLSVSSFTANPSSGTAPLNDVDLTATVDGTATGTINYTFYCNRSDSEYAAKYDGVWDNPKTAPDVCNYSTPGTYTAKVIVERGSAPPAEAQTTVTTSSPAANPPSIDTYASEIDSDSAKINITVNPNGSETTVSLQWGTSTSYENTDNLGVVMSNTSGSYTLEGLSANTTYYYRGVARNSAGTTYETGKSFKTLDTPVPTVSSVSPTSMIPDGLSHTLTINGNNFQVGNIVQFKWLVGSDANEWTNGRGNPPNISSSSKMSIDMNPGTVSDFIYVRVCRSSSQTTESDCSTGLHYIFITNYGI